MPKKCLGNGKALITHTSNNARRAEDTTASAKAIHSIREALAETYLLSGTKAAHVAIDWNSVSYTIL